jgi:ribonuclease HI
VPEGGGPALPAPDPDELEVARLERELLTRPVRADRARLERLLHPAFAEHGSSGRRWTRDDIVADLLRSPDPGAVEVRDLVADRVAPDVVLVTYVAERADARTRRSSVWVRHDGRWVVRFHQGTPVPGRQ